MAWFECTTGASSGNGVALIVTTDASFAGTNITASNGEDTFTQQCPSSAPYVVTFEDIPTGTYTISGVRGGQTVSKTFVVSDYNFEFHDIPTGSTATPVNVIQTWLHCAEIWDKTYTTINQVLADTSTLLALISSNNAADYMARSTNWASSVSANQTAMGYIGNNNYCATKLLANSTWCNAICNSTYSESVLKTKVPTMTSNTTPSGEAIANETYDSGHEAFRAFDNSDSTRWAGRTTNAGVYCGYKFTTQMLFKKLFWKSAASIIGNYIIKGSNDGNTWTPIGSEFAVSGSSSGTINYPNNTTKYSRIALFSNGGNTNGSSFISLQFYGRA